MLSKPTDYFIDELKDLILATKFKLDQEMDISKEELEKFWAEKQQSVSRRKSKMDTHERISNSYQAGNLGEISPLWNITDIDLDKQPHQLDESLLTEGYTILEDVDIELLFDKMFEGNPDMFREKILYNKDLIKENISEIIDLWQNQVPLIPPTIVISDRTLPLIFKDTDKLFPADGKHRINVAYYFGAKRIPIFVANKQLEKMKRILDIQ